MAESREFDQHTAVVAVGGPQPVDDLYKFIEHPQAFVPGTKMTLAGIVGRKAGPT